MNVYDFDNTIYNGDSTKDFYVFAVKRHKKILLLLPSLSLAFFKYYVFKKGTKTKFKEKMYRFLNYCDIDKDVKDFWDKHIVNMKRWYKAQQKEDDLIISASPEFLLKPLEKILGFKVIASKVDKHSGKYSGNNCYWDEKVTRFYEIYPDGEIDEFYSDHYSDEPLAKEAKEAFIVDKDEIIPWDHTKHIKPRI